MAIAYINNRFIFVPGCMSYLPLRVVRTGDQLCPSSAQPSLVNMCPVPGHSPFMRERPFSYELLKRRICVHVHTEAKMSRSNTGGKLCSRSSNMNSNNTWNNWTLNHFAKVLRTSERTKWRESTHNSYPYVKTHTNIHLHWTFHYRRQAISKL